MKVWISHDARLHSARLLVGLLCLACEEPTAFGIRDQPDIRDAVTANALAALDGDGRFIIAPDVPSGPEGVPLVSSARARELAAAFTHSYGPAFVGYWAYERGAAIPLEQLAPSPRPYPAISAFGPVPNVGCHPSDVRIFGSFYLMTMDVGGEQHVRMAVSAQTTDFGIEADGDIDEPNRTGSDFFHEGVRRDRSVGFLLSPEQAVDLVYRWTGARATEVPRIAMRWTYTPSFGLWRVDLDRAVRVLRNEQIQHVSTIFVGPNARERFYVAADEQPATVAWSCSLIDENLVDSGMAAIEVATTGASPLVFEAVVLLRD